jgi:hypothetical protein
MAWIPLTSNRVPFRSSIAIKLYSSESLHLVVSMGAWEAMGRPEAVSVLFDPDVCAIALKPAKLGEGFKVFCYDRGHNGTVERVYINAAGALRRIMRLHGYSWPAQAISLALLPEGALLVTSIPQGYDEEGGDEEAC